MATIHREFYAEYFWEHLSGYLLRKENIRTQLMDFNAKKEEWRAGDARQDSRGNWDLFPAQHYIMPCVDFGSTVTPRVISFWVWDAQNEPRVNGLYLKMWLQWKIRSVSNADFIPEDKKGLFIAHRDAFEKMIGKEDLELLAAPEAFLIKQQEQIRERLYA